MKMTCLQHGDNTYVRTYEICGQRSQDHAKGVKSNLKRVTVGGAQEMGFMIVNV